MISQSKTIVLMSCGMAALGAVLVLREWQHRRDSLEFLSALNYWEHAFKVVDKKAAYMVDYIPDDVVDKLNDELEEESTFLKIVNENFDFF